MRELILKMGMSVDGFVSDLEGANAWMFGADEEAKKWNVDLVSGASLHLLGSRSFNAMAAYWQTSTDPFAAPMNGIPKAVFTRQGNSILEKVSAEATRQSLQAAGREPVLQENAESWGQSYVAGDDIVAEVTRLKAEGGKPMIAHGGVTFAQSLVQHGLVDRFILVVAPIALGQGLPLFSQLPRPQRLALVESRAFPGGVVAQTYLRTG